MSLTSFLSQVLSIAHMVILGVDFEPDPLWLQFQIIIQIRINKRYKHICPHCGKKGTFYDCKKKPRRWRHLDMFGFRTYFEATVDRISCHHCRKVVVEQVPWAGHKAKHTRMFEENLVWHALHATFKTVSEMFCVNWHTVGDIMQRYYEDNKLLFTPSFDNLRCIGIDETSYKKGHKFITVVVNQDTGGVLWVHIGYGYEVLKLFFLELTPEQRANIEFITGDGAKYIEQCRVDFCPKAVRCMDAFHTVSWATEAVDEVRREAFNAARLKLEALVKAAEKAEKEAEKATKKGSKKTSKKGSKKAPKKGGKKNTKKAKKKGVVIDSEMEKAQQRMDALKGAKYAYLHNPMKRTEGQIGKIELIARTEPALNEALILKDQLVTILKMDKESAKEALGIWVKDSAGALSSKFTALSEKIERHIPAILATIEHGLSNARIEAINNNIKVTSRMGYGYRNIDNLIALIMIRCSSYHMPYPGRTRRFPKIEKSA